MLPKKQIFLKKTTNRSAAILLWISFSCWIRFISELSTTSCFWMRIIPIQIFVHFFVSLTNNLHITIWYFIIIFDVFYIQSRSTCCTLQTSFIPWLQWRTSRRGRKKLHIKNKEDWKRKDEIESMDLITLSRHRISLGR